jgi:anti-anti-sigma factor
LWAPELINMTRGRTVTVKQLPEKLDAKQGRLFVREVESCLKADRPLVVIDCSKLRQLDSAGIQVLLRCLEEVMKRNGDVKLASIPPAAAAILELTRVDRLFEAFDSIADAVNSFHQFPTKPFEPSLRHEYSTLTSGESRNGSENGQSGPGERPLDSEVTMEASGRGLGRQIVGCLAVLLVVPFAAAAGSPRQEANPGQQVQEAVSAQVQPQALDGSATKTGSGLSQSEGLPNSPGASQPQAEDSRLSSEQQPSPNQQQDDTREPLGTAAAPSVKTTGVAASRPAGAAIAPARQRRARSILIKVGAIVGAGVAVGTVVALSKASPSRPSGSR